MMTRNFFRYGEELHLAAHVRRSSYFLTAGLPAVVSEKSAFYTKPEKFQAIPKNICINTPAASSPQPALPIVSSHG